MVTKATASGKEVSYVPRNITLVTNGMRVRVRAIADLPTVNLVGVEFSTQNELQDIWEKRVGNIKENKYVPGAGEHGIFSANFADQVKQITDLDNVWCPSTGLGMVCLGANYPQYDLGDFDADISRCKVVNDKTWWDFVCGLSGNSMTSVIMGATAAGHRVVMAIPGIQYFQYKEDLLQLITSAGDKLPLLRERLRFVGPELDNVLPPPLLPCAMPYDKAALDRLVPGVRVNGTRRMAALLLDVVKTPKDGRTDPREDYDAMQEALHDKGREPIAYESHSGVVGSRVKKLTDEEAAEKVAECAALVGDVPHRIVRMLRHEGYAVKIERVEALLKGSKSAASSGTSGKASAKPKAATAPAATAKRGKARA